jgi:hypothetical protein
MYKLNTISYEKAQKNISKKGKGLYGQMSNKWRLLFQPSMPSRMHRRPIKLTNIMTMDAIIVEGRWVKKDGTPLDPCELHRVHNQFNRIHAFADGEIELTHSKIEMLSKILHITPTQEEIILKVMNMTEEDLHKLV